MQKSSNNKILFFGSFEFAVPVLKALVSAGYDIIAVVTNSDKPAGRKKTLTSPPVKITAQRLGLKIYQPQKLEIGNWKLEIPDADIDVGVVVGYNKIIPAEIFNLPKHGTLNIHPSLLPKYRGPSPVQTAILNGDSETGITIMKLAEGVDDGEIISNLKVKISNLDTSATLHAKLFELGTKLLIKTLPDYLSGKIKPQLQDHSKATFTRKFKSEDGEINNADTPEQAYNKIRAFNPEPSAYIWLEKNDKKLRLKILEAVLTNNGLELKKVQLEGGKPMSIKEFFTGHPKFKNYLL